MKLNVASAKLKSVATANIYHRPTLPAVTLKRPLTGRVEVAVADGVAVVPVEVALAKSQRPFAHEFLLDGRQLDVADAPQLADGIISGSISVRANPATLPDSHSLVLRLRNQWGATRDVPIAVTLKHRPTITGLQLTPTTDRNACTIRADVATPDNRPIEAVQVQINDQPVNRPRFTLKDNTLSVRGITLPVGQNQITLTAINSDGPSEPLRGAIVGLAAPKPPVVAIHSPVRDTQVTTAGTSLVASIKSDKPIESAEVVVSRNARRDRRYVVPQNRLRLVDNATQIEQPIRLDPGVNRVVLTVTSGAGTTTQTTEVTYLVPPLTLELTQLVPSGVGAPLVPSQESGGTSFNAALRTGRATLKGRLSWLEGHKPPGDSWTLRLWTNGFLMPVRVIPARSRGNRLDFEVPLVLGQKTNRIRIEPVELPVDEIQRSQLADIRIQCEQPDRDQNLHLLIVGVDMVDGRNNADSEKLRSLAERALRLQSGDQVFKDVRIYGR